MLAVSPRSSTEKTQHSAQEVIMEAIEVEAEGEAVPVAAVEEERESVAWTVSET